MTVASTTNRKSFSGDGVTTSFGTSPVVFYESTDLVVEVFSSAGAATTLTAGTQYTVSGGSTTGATGTVNLAGGTAPYGAPAVGTTLLIRRVLPLVQEADFVNNDINDAEVSETALDKLTMIAQQISETSDRGVAIPAVETATDALTVLPFDRASKYLAFDANKEMIASDGPAGDNVPVSTFMATVLDDTSAGDAQTTLGGTTVGKALFTAASAVAARTTLEAAPKGNVLTRSSNTILAGANDGDTLIATSTYTQTLTAAATLGDGWAIDIVVDSGVTLTLDPNSTETVDGSATKAIIGPAQGRLVCNGTLFRTIGFQLTQDAYINALSGDVALNDTGLYFDGPSVANGNSGTFFASGQICVTDTAGPANINVKLWDGTNVIASAQVYVPASSAVVAVHLSGYITNPSGNIKISANDVTSTSGAIKNNASGNGRDASLFCFRIS
jgi:hypothetical protein